MRTEVSINPTILSWAISRAGFDMEQFLNNNPTIQKWIEEVKKPTVKQLEAFATKVHIPFGYLFMPEPPKECIPFPFFRTGNTNTDKVSLNVFDTIQILQRRRFCRGEIQHSNKLERFEKITLKKMIDK